MLPEHVFRYPYIVFAAKRLAPRNLTAESEDFRWKLSPQVRIMADWLSRAVDVRRINPKPLTLTGDAWRNACEARDRETDQALNAVY